MPILPTTTVGSSSIPGWLHIAREEIGRGTLGPTEIREIYDAAVGLAIREQERARLDVISDGEMRQFHFTQGLSSRLAGLRPLGSSRRLGSPGYDQVPTYEIVEEIAAPNGLGIVEELGYAVSQTDRPLKVARPRPLTFTLAVTGFGPYRECLAAANAYASFINVEMSALPAAGAWLVQLDEPSFSYFDVPPATLADLYNRCVDGVTVKRALHICFGNFHNRPRTSRSYRKLFPDILQARADQFIPEFANRELSEIELWKELAVDRELGFGVVDVKSYYPERPNAVAATIRTALKYVAADKLWINPDCGFNHTPHHAGLAKMTAMVAGARIVRHELTGQSEPDSYRRST